jgi:hypothetical protein
LICCVIFLSTLASIRGSTFKETGSIYVAGKENRSPSPR